MTLMKMMMFVMMEAVGQDAIELQFDGNVGVPRISICFRVGQLVWEQEE
jgi:hypothetical protein